jgi:nucleoside 2-deoxyribosyltransferase
LPDAVAFGREKARRAAAAGFNGLFPLDQQLDVSGLKPAESAARISAANENLMRSADLLIANCTPFRGASMDCGTAFEVGFMRALGRPVLGYINTPLDHRRRAEMIRALSPLPYDCDRADVEIEDFGLAENLMIDVAITASGSSLVRRTVAPGSEMTDLAGFDACLADARRLLGLS